MAIYTVIMVSLNDTMPPPAVFIDRYFALVMIGTQDPLYEEVEHDITPPLVLIDFGQAAEMSM